MSIELKRSSINSSPQIQHLPSRFSICVRGLTAHRNPPTKKKQSPQQQQENEKAVNSIWCRSDLMSNFDTRLFALASATSGFKRVEEHVLAQENWFLCTFSCVLGSCCVSFALLWRVVGFCTPLFSFHFFSMSLSLLNNHNSFSTKT